MHPISLWQWAMDCSRKEQCRCPAAHSTIAFKDAACLAEEGSRPLIIQFSLMVRHLPQQFSQSQSHAWPQLCACSQGEALPGEQ